MCINCRQEAVRAIEQLARVTAMPDRAECAQAAIRKVDNWEAALKIAGLSKEAALDQYMELTPEYWRDQKTHTVAVDLIRAIDTIGGRGTGTYEVTWIAATVLDLERVTLWREIIRRSERGLSYFPEGLIKALGIILGV